MKDCIETYLAHSMTITDVESLMILDPKCELLKTFIDNGAPIKLKDGADVKSLSYDDIELTGEMIRTRSDKPGVRYEWKW